MQNPATRPEFRNSCGCGSQPHRIDTHHHIFPPRYLERERDRILAPAPGYTTQLTQWTPQKSLDAMDANGVATAVTSVSAPGIWFGDTESTRTLARECNEFAAQMSGDHKGRFGVFAVLPLPDVDNSLKEIAYALDVLGADGIGLVTNYGDVLPGDSRIAPVFDELNRRKAVVYFHPTAATGCVNIATGLPPAILEFPFDTTRAVASLLTSGTLSRCPEIRFIFSHGGGTLPMLAGRIARVMGARKELAEKVPNGTMHELRKLYFDLVSINTPAAFQALRSIAEIPQLLFGSDFPYWSPAVAVEEIRKLDLAPQELEDIEHKNALRLIPALAMRAGKS